MGLLKGCLSFVESKYLQAFGEFAPCRRREMSLTGLQCHWLISLYRDLQKYPCFCGFEWCTLRIFFLSYTFLASLGSLEPIPFKEVNLVHFIHPLLGFHTHLRLFLFVPLVGPCLQIAPFVGTCYSLYPLLVHATVRTHCWYMLQVVAMTRICLQSVLLPIVGTCYSLCPQTFAFEHFLGHTWKLSGPCI